MLNRFFIAVTLAGCFGAGSFLHAQQGEHSTSSTTTTATNDRKLHVQGCIFPQEALTSTAPVHVYAGSKEDYVLTNLKVISASPGITVPDGKIFKLEQFDQNEMRGYIGKSVGVVGRVVDTPAMSQLQVISIRETSGGCPISPTSR